MNPEGPTFPLGTPIPKGTVLHLGPAAGVQWRHAPIWFLVVGELDWKTSWHGTVYLDGYQIDTNGKTVARRTVYVIKAGVRVVPPQPPPVLPRRRRRKEDALAGCR